MHDALVHEVTKHTAATANNAAAAATATQLQLHDNAARIAAALRDALRAVVAEYLKEEKAEEEEEDRRQEALLLGVAALLTFSQLNYTASAPTNNATAGATSTVSSSSLLHLSLLDASTNTTTNNNTNDTNNNSSSSIISSNVQEWCTRALECDGEDVVPCLVLPHLLLVARVLLVDSFKLIDDETRLPYAAWWSLRAAIVQQVGRSVGWLVEKEDRKRKNMSSMCAQFASLFCFHEWTVLLSS